MAKSYKLTSPQEALCAAAKRGHVAAMQQALDNGANIDSPPKPGRNPALIVAAEAGQAAAVEYLLGQGAAPDVKGHNDCLDPAAKAMQKNRTAVLHVLFNHPHFIQVAQNGYLCDGFQFTTSRSTVDLVTRFQVEQREQVLEETCRGWTALHHAAYAGDYMWANTLLHHGLGDARDRDAKGRTPLHVVRPQRHPTACVGTVHGTDGYQNAFFLATKLIVHGASADDTDNQGMTPEFLRDPETRRKVSQEVSDRQANIYNITYKPKSVRRKPTSDDELALQFESAAASGNVPELRDLLNLGATVQMLLGKRRATALHLAAEHGHQTALCFLLEARSNVNARAHWQRTPLHYAVTNKHPEVVRLLLDAGADPNTSDAHGFSPLIYLIRVSDRADIAELLLRGGASLLPQGRIETESKNPVSFTVDRLTPLHLAAKKGRAAILQVLLENGGDPNVQTEANGITPLHCVPGYIFEDVSQKQAAATVKTLLMFGADPELNDFCGGSALLAAANDNDAVILKLMQMAAKEKSGGSDGPDFSPSAIMACAAAGDLEKLRKLVASGADLTCRDDCGRTALHSAALHGHADFVACLLSEGCEVGAIDGENNSALHLAAEHGHAKTIEVLLFHGASIDARNASRRTPLAQACWEKRDKAVKMLLENGAHVGETNAEMLELLHGAVGYNGYHLESAAGRKVTRILLEHGAEVIAEDDVNPCALHHARRRLRDVLRKQAADSDIAEKAFERLQETTLPEILDLLDYFAKEMRARGKN